jgi:U4/U6.U5 tri-snRNP component SNU23
VNLSDRLGKTQVIGLNTPLNQQAGYYCSVCDCVLRDSQSYLDHINGKYHNRALGMSMKVEKSSVEQVGLCSVMIWCRGVVAVEHAVDA